MLGMLRKLHRMQIQIQLESQSEDTKIIYPNVEVHKKRMDMIRPRNLN